mgnify:CR=1 FL=1
MTTNVQEMFGSLLLDKKIVASLTAMGFEEPSPIQEQTIPLVLEGSDVIGQAQTGTGKTAAFGIPVVQSITDHRHIQALIMTPTRELAIQVAEEIGKIGRTSKIKALPVYGGQPIDRQIRALRSGVQIVIGTPGRLIDHINRKTIKLDHIKFLVLDEADEMLDMGFVDDMEEIMKNLPAERQTLLFSATMPRPILSLTKKYMKAPKNVTISKEELTVPLIDQYYFETKDKIEGLCRLLDAEIDGKLIIFCRTKKGVDDLVAAMQARGYMVEGMHGDMSQVQRMKTLAKFKNGSLKFLVATDVAARGIDVDGVTHVFNYELPQDIESYVHRIGRTGRAGREGTAYSIITPKEFGFLKQIKNVTKGNIEKRQVPTVQEIYDAKFKAMTEEVSSIIEAEDYSKFVNVATQLTETHDSVKVIASLLQSQFKNQLSFDYSTDKLEAPAKVKGNDVRLFFSAGRRDGLTIKNLINYIKDNAKVGASQIRDIDIMENFAFVNVDDAIHMQVLEKCTGGKINKRRVNVEVSTNNKKRSRNKRSSK